MQKPLKHVIGRLKPIRRRAGTQQTAANLLLNWQRPASCIAPCLKKFSFACRDAVKAIRMPLGDRGKDAVGGDQLRNRLAASHGVLPAMLG
jgi:hypothetical protein